MIYGTKRRGYIQATIEHPACKWEITYEPITQKFILYKVESVSSNPKDENGNYPKGTEIWVERFFIDECDTMPGALRYVAGLSEKYFDNYRKF